MRKLVAPLVAIIVIAIAYLVYNHYQHKQELSRLDNEVDQIQGEPKASPKESFEKPNASWLDSQRSSFVDKEELKPVVPAPKTASVSEEEVSDEKDDENINEQMRTIFQEYVKETYSSLFDKMNLPEEKKQQLLQHLVQNQMLQQEISVMLLDTKMNDEDILKRQAQLDNTQQETLAKLIDPPQVEMLDDFNKELPKQMAEKNIMHNIKPLGLGPDQQEKVKEIIYEEEMKSTSPIAQLAKRQGNPLATLTHNNIKGVRKLVVATSQDNPSELIGMVKDMKKTNSNIYNKLEPELSKEELDKYKKQRNADVKMLESAMDMDMDQKTTK